MRIQIVADSKFPVNRRKLRERLRAVLRKHKIDSDVELMVMIVGGRKMKQLNKLYMKKESLTDVLSFPLNDPDDPAPFVSSPDNVLRLGDIVVCYPVAIEYALKRQVLLDDVVCDLAEHGCLHLLGIHHD